MHPLRASRIAVSTAVLVVAAILFLDIRHRMPTSIFDTVLAVQFGPAVLDLVSGAGGAMFVIAFLFLLTLLFGRLYCSFLCPLGALQDLVLWLRTSKFKHRRFPYVAPRYRWHYVITGMIVLSAVAGSMILVNIFEPFSSTGRMLSHLVRPMLILINNFASFLSRAIGGHGLAEVPLAWPGVWTLVGAGVFAVFIVAISYRSGRVFCNLLCPVGGILSLLSHKPMFAIRIHEHECIDCGLCERVCRAQCIDGVTRTIDSAACVVCFDCMDSCPTHGIAFQWGVEPGARRMSDERRHTVSVLGAAAVSALLPDGMKEEQQAVYDRAKSQPVVPPGGQSRERFSQRCTGCQMCVSACPTHVIQPALAHYGWEGIFQPRMDYAVQYCTYDCLRCGEVCPTGALQPLTIERKHITQIGKAVFVKEDCVVETKKKDCGACAEHCPTKAVKMIPYEGKLQIPKVDNEYCVGCGACEHACPTEPRRAIYIEPHIHHQIARARIEEHAQPRESVPTDFPF